MKIYITGASGFVGRNLIDYLKSSHDVTTHVREKGISGSHDVIIHLAGLSILNDKNGDASNFYSVNYGLTRDIYNDFLDSKSSKFIFLSSIKSVAEYSEQIITEELIPNPVSDYGKSKLQAENYIINQKLSEGKKFFILRSTLIHGPNNKGNISLLYKLVSKGIPWPLAKFTNKRSFCSIDNLNFIINELVERDDIPSGIYNVADDEPISTNDLIRLIGLSLGKKVFYFNIPKSIILFFAKIGTKFNFSFNYEKLLKLTESYSVSNQKIKGYLKKDLPLSTTLGFIKTFNSLKK